MALLESGARSPARLSHRRLRISRRSSGMTHRGAQQAAFLRSISHLSFWARPARTRPRTYSTSRVCRILYEAWRSRSKRR